VQVISGNGYRLAEGARWVDGRLVFVDILGKRLYEYRDGTTSTLAELDVHLGAIAPIAGSPRRWIVAAGTGIAILEPSGALTWLARPEDDAPQPNRMNDAGCDAAGRFWAGSMAYDNAPGAGSLYRVDTDGTVTRVLDGITCVNGPTFSADGRRMYYADSPAACIYVCDLEPDSGEILDHREFARVDKPAGPDGMTVDSTGRLWNAVWDGSVVNCYTTDGALERVIDVPARRPTSVCIADGQLYVTTASVGLDDAGPAEGAVLAMPIDATAPPATAFRFSR
jgi:sugar lactone lactonase YvrE